MTAAHALALVRRADATWNPEAQAELLDEAIRLAREADDPKLEYAARMRAVPAAALRFAVGDALTHVAWCVSRHDSENARFPRRLPGTEDLLYLEDWCLRQICLSDAVGPGDVETLIDAHERRLGPGSGDHSVAVLRALHAWACGDLVAAIEAVRRALALPGDAMTHCTRCTRDIAAQIFEAAGDHASVVTVCDDYLTDPCTDLDQPASALSRGLFAWHTSGRGDEAESAYRKAAGEAAPRETTPEVLGRLARFALAAGRDDDALAHVEAALPWVFGPSIATHLRLGALRELSAALTGLDLRGLGGRELRAARDPRTSPLLPARTEGWTVSSARPALVREARELAARFDARAGTMFHVEQLERLLAETS